jgi:hypothetical protein
VFIFNGIQVVISEKIKFFITSAVGTPNPRQTPSIYTDEYVGLRCSQRKKMGRKKEGRENRNKTERKKVRKKIREETKSK